MSFSQPPPCGSNPQMASFCADACVICDIDGFTGINDINAIGQPLPDFCTTMFDKLQYIAFVAGTENLTIRVDVGNCFGTFQNSLEIGFFESLDCIEFNPITMCDTDVGEFTSQTFSNFTPLTIGQHYYLVMDGSNGTTCEWTFNVVSGSTESLPLQDVAAFTHPAETCPNNPTTFTAEQLPSAALYFWSVDGQTVSGNSNVNEITFDELGEYQVCVSPGNVCNQGPEFCSIIIVREFGNLEVTEVVCDGECVEYNGTQFCNSGFYQESVQLPNGCDSLINLNLTVLPQPVDFVDLWICNDQSYFIGDTPYNLTGSYVDTVLTSNDCDSIVFLELRVIECEIIGIPDEIPVICNGTATGTLIFSVDQGEPPLSYTYTNIFEPEITGDGMTNLLVDNQIPNIPVGTYQIYISDDFGNDVVVLQEVTEPPILEIAFDSLDYNGYGVSCFESYGVPVNDGELTAMPSGGVAPYEYLWSNGQSVQTAENLLAQEYTVTITDMVGCSIVQSYTLSSAPELILSANYIDPNCDGPITGIVNLDQVSGGVPDYTFALNDGLFSEQLEYENLPEGAYFFSVQDENNCVVIDSGILVTPDIPEITFEEDLTIYLGDSVLIEPIINDIEIDSVVWNGNEGLSCDDCLNPFSYVFNNSTYVLTVVSDDGCKDTESVNVFVDKRRRVYVPNVFNVNDTGANDRLVVYAGIEAAQVNTYKIYDRWGNLIFNRNNFMPNDLNSSWDGSYAGGSDVLSGVYVWFVEVQFLDGIIETYTGTVSLIK